MPRLFTGLELPPDVARTLSLAQGGLSGARWIEAADFHITLRFIGDVGEAAADEAHSALERIRRAPFNVSLTGLGAFGGARPRAVVAFVKPVPALLELQAEQERLLRRLGCPAETRKYTPHVTLARLRQTPPVAVAQYLSQRGFLAAREFPVDRFALFSARDSVGGGPYLAEATYALRRTAD